MNLSQIDSTTSPIIGIDLGTTNSLVAYVRNGIPEVLRSREGHRMVPSVVSLGSPFDREHAVTVGYAAKHLKVRQAKNTLFSVKRLLGRSYEDLKSDLKNLPFEVLPGDGIARIRVGEQIFTAIEVSAMILRELKASAEQALNVPVQSAVITVPAYFNDAQRQATRAAGKLAGLDVLRIVNEPTAAALAYGLDRKNEGLIAVYDLGGGTFDVSILRLHQGIFEVLATAGNTTLGGDDFDRILADIFEQEILAQKEPGFELNIEQKAALLEAAELAKIALSSQQRAIADVEIDFETHFQREVTQVEFEALVRPLLEKTRVACMQALGDAGIHTHELSDVVMVGGPTRLAVVQEIAHEIFGRVPNTSVHPDEVVALGAAIQADILAGNNKDVLLLDVVPLSLGIETYGGLMSTLIPRNTKVPTTAREVFTTYVDRQTGVDIHVLQGERERVSDNRSLARFKLKGIEPMPAGLPRVEVTFLIDADGILQVSAKDLKTGKAQRLEVKPSFGLTDVEIEKMLGDSEQNKKNDELFRKVVEAKTEAEPILRATESKLDLAKKKLPTDEYGKIEQHVFALRTALKSDDPELIHQASFLLSSATTKLADLIVKEAIAQSSGFKSE